VIAFNTLHHQLQVIFSDAGNQISCKRTRFGLNLVSKMLFIKRNDEYIDMFKEK